MGLNPITGGLLLGGVGSVGSALLGGKKKSSTQVPLQTPQEALARSKLLELADSGTLNDLRLGEDIGLPEGVFDLSGLERDAIGAFEDRFREGGPSSLFSAIDTTLEFLNDPTIDPAGTFAPFKDRLESEIRDRNDALKREAGVFGDLFSTNTVQRLGDVQNEGSQIIAERLAGLTNQALDRRLTAANQLGGLSSLLESIQRGRIGDLLGVGGLERELENARINQERQEILRRRGEDLGRIDALTSVLRSPTQFGVPSVDVAQSSPFQGVLDLVSRIGGDIVGGQIQKDIYKDIFSQPQ